MARNQIFGVLKLMDYFRMEMNHLTNTNINTPMSTNPPGISVNNSKQAKKNESNKAVMDVSGNAIVKSKFHLSNVSIDVKLLFRCVKSLLLNCSALISVNIRDTIEAVISQGLMCLSKGILLKQLPDRHIKRFATVTHLYLFGLLRCDALIV